MQQLHRTKETVRDSQKPWKSLRDMQQLHGTEMDSERDIERHEATPWNWRDCETQPAAIGDSERHAATPQDRRDSARQPATIGHSEIHAATPWN